MANVNQLPETLTASRENPLEADLPRRHMEINLGPSHPAMHGVVRTHRARR